MENASSRLDDLHRIATHAGSVRAHYDTFRNILILEDVDQATLDNAIATLPPVQITGEQVSIERERRIEAGFTFNGVAYDSYPPSLQNISGAALLATIAMANGAEAGDLRWHGGASDFSWTAADNSQVPMDAPTMQAFGVAAALHVDAHHRASQALKAMTPIPSDYTSDTYWP